MPILSILIPVYNVEKYLAQCLESVINQTLSDIEIIVINDGSKDNSLNIIKDFAAKDKRIIVIDKENEGYGKSMNRGLDVASGKYIGIVESDDWIEPNMYEKLISTAEKYKADIVKANFFSYTTNNGEKNEKINLFPEIYSERPFSPREKTFVFFCQPSIWSSIYNREFLNKNDIRFLESPGASYQDIGFSFKVWVSAKTVVLLNDAFLHYRCDNETASVKSKGKVFCVTDEWNEIEKYLKDRNKLNKNLEKIIAHVKLGNYLWNFKRLDGEEQKAFLKQFQKEYSKYISENILDKIYFDDKSWNKLLRIIYPKSVSKMIRKAVFDLVHPIYKTQVMGNYKKKYLFGKINIGNKEIPALKI